MYSVYKGLHCFFLGRQIPISLISKIKRSAIIYSRPTIRVYICTSNASIISPRGRRKEITGVKPYSFLKRVVAISGDTVEIKGGGVFVNGVYLEEPYVEKPNSTFPLKKKYEWSKENNLDGLFLEECQKITVPDNSLFVLGDNRENSDDSRTIGFINIDDVGHYLPYKEQQETYYEGVNPLNHSDKWRNTKEDYANLEKSGLIKCKN